MNCLKMTKQNDFINNRGFSLIELLISLVIISIVSVAVYGVFYLASRSYTTQSVSADVQQSIRAATEVLMQDIRTAGLDPTSSGNFGIELAEATKFRFTSDSSDTGGDFNGILEDVAAHLPPELTSLIKKVFTKHGKNGPFPHQEEVMRKDPWLADQLLREIRRANADGIFPHIDPNWMPGWLPRF